MGRRREAGVRGRRSDPGAAVAGGRGAVGPVGGPPTGGSASGLARLLRWPAGVEPKRSDVDPKRFISLRRPELSSHLGRRPPIEAGTRRRSRHDGSGKVRGMAPLPWSLQVQARTQFGLLTRSQALATLSKPALQRRLSSGLLLPAGRGVYRLPGATPSWRQRAMASCLHMGGEVAVSHLAAAYLWRAESVAAPPIQLTVPRGRRSQAFRPPPRRSLLPATDVTTRWGIPTTTPARTIVDLSMIVAPPLLARVVDDLCRARHLHVEDLDRRVAAGELPRHRARVLHEIVAVRLRRGPTAGRGGSAREEWVMDALIAGCLPAPARNVIVEVGGTLRELDSPTRTIESGSSTTAGGSTPTLPTFTPTGTRRPSSN